MEPFLADPDVTIYCGDALDVLRELPDESVHMCCTSPPFYGLRDYGCDGQIGLEATPDQWVAALVQVFREVRRVLRADGTCWVEIGDSYAQGHGGSSTEGNYTMRKAARGPANAPAKGTFACSYCGWSTDSYTALVEHHKNEAGHSPGGADYQRRGSVRNVLPGYKPKDLIGAPWLLAEALKAPYYTGKIRDERDRVWLAAIIDGEGSISVNRLRASERNDRKRDSFGPYLRVHNTSEAIVQRCAQITGAGSVKVHDSRGRPCHVWAVYGNTAREILREVYPHLTAKQHEARLAYGCNAENGEKAWAGLKALHSGHVPELDCPTPPSMFEPGWYLRSEIIWAKPNPMPESVTDRPTQSHSRVFLLSKTARYFYDAEAIRESASENTHARYAVARETPKGREGHVGWDETTNGHVTHRNRRSVWTIATQPYPEAHFATWPTRLVEPMILAGTSERGVCRECGAPWERIVERGELIAQERARIRADEFHNGAHAKTGDPSSRWANRARDGVVPNHFRPAATTGWQPACNCQPERAESAELVPSIVLDPFGGSGTTAHVARKHGRKAILIELNPDYCRLAADRLAQQSLLAEGAA